MIPYLLDFSYNFVTIRIGDSMFVPIEKGNTTESNYKIMLENAQYYINKDDSLLTTLSNLSAYLNYFLDDINWVGFYLYDGEKLFLGPFQGLPACTIIHLGNGVCGSAAKELKTYLVDDVDAFPGHIACDGNSKSEIVVPIIKNGILKGVLDIDSPLPSRFNDIDKTYLEKLIITLVQIAF